MQFAEDLGGGWRAGISARLRDLDYHPLNITEMDKAYQVKHGQLYFKDDADGDVKKHLKFKSNIRQHFIHADLELIKQNSDAVILYYDQSVRLGAGTLGEAQVAYLHDVPLFVVSEWGDDWKEVPGWLQALSTKMFPNFAHLLDYLEYLPVGILQRDMYGNHGAKSQYLCSLCGDVFTKKKHHFVSQILPTYCSPCVNLIAETHEGHVDRYTFLKEFLSESEHRNLD